MREQSHLCRFVINPNSKKWQDEPICYSIKQALRQAGSTYNFRFVKIEFH